MKEVDFIVPKDLEPFVNCIMVQESDNPSAHTNIPLYADGYPGIMFQQSENDFYLLPKGKKLSELFLYGQTLDPASLDSKGKFKFVVFQLYPFASKHLLGVDPKALNGDCFDLLQLKHIDAEAFHQQLISATTLEEQAQVITRLVLALVKSNQVEPDDRIQQAISIIIEQKGKVQIKELQEQVYLTERTLERNFSAETGLTPKQFARIIQFQTSLRQLTKKSYDKLVDIGFNSGFADQSHFIRAFKKYTGQSPSYYLKEMTG